MSIDCEKLKVLAEAAGGVAWTWWTSNSTLRLTTQKEGRHGADGDALSAYGDSINCQEAYREFIAAAHPAAVLALLAENEALRKNAGRYLWLREHHWLCEKDVDSKIAAWNATKEVQP